MEEFNHIKLLEICKLILVILVFSVVFDPGNLHFGLKNLSFFAFCFFCIPFFNGKFFYVPFFCITLYFVAYAHGVYIQTNIDSSIALWNLTSFLFLIIIVFIFDVRMKLLKSLYYISLLLSVYILLLALTALPFFPFNTAVINHITNNEDFIMYGIRSIYGMPHFCLYYRTCSICIIPEACALILLAKTGNKKYFVHFTIFFLELFISGARANMIAAILVLITFWLSYLLFVKRRVLLFILLTSGFLVAAIVILGLLVSEKENSNLVKLGHFSSYMELFDSAPLRYFFIGSGPGTIIYSKGFGKFTALTELSYFELIKSYGLLPSVILVTIFLIPVFMLWYSKYLIGKYGVIAKVSLITAYFSFFFVAATNPLFIGSTGFMTIIAMFYICDKNFFDEFDISCLKNRYYNIRKYLRFSI